MEAVAAGERLQKVLAQAGLASRRQAEDWIRAGRVTVNGVAAVLGQRVQHRDEIKVDGRSLRQDRGPARTRKGSDHQKVAFICHRSPGDELRTGMMERLPRRAGRRFVAVSPLPQIDGGLELLTSDGALAMRLQRLVREWPVEFSVRARGALEPLRQQSLLRGELDDGTVVRIEALQAGAAEGEGANQWHHVLTRGASGKAVRQLFERQGLVVSRVLRTSLGPLRLTRELGRGHFRNLDAEEGRALDAALAGEPVPIAPSHTAPPPALPEDEADFEVPVHKPRAQRANSSATGASGKARTPKAPPRARPTGRRSSRP